MKNWRFAFQRRWFTYLGMAVAFAIACGFLSHWQFGRNAQVSAENTLVTTNYVAKAVAVDKILSTRDAYTHADIWRPVEMVGRYLPSKQILVRDRSRGSNPGFEVLTPFRMSNGSIFIVDRGWVAIGMKHTYPDYIPAAPKGTVTLTARLQGSEALLPGRTSPRGQIAEINLPTVATMLRSRADAAKTYVGAYGLLDKETPAPANRPARASKPDPDPGPFLSYAFQWILFAIMGFGGLAWALRQEYRIRNADDPDERLRAAERARKARLKTPTDSDIEDAQIRDAQIRDAQLRDARPSEADRLVDVP